MKGLIIICLSIILGIFASCNEKSNNSSSNVQYPDYETHSAEIEKLFSQYVSFNIGETKTDEKMENYSILSVKNISNKTITNIRFSTLVTTFPIDYNDINLKPGQTKSFRLYLDQSIKIIKIRFKDGSFLDESSVPMKFY